MHFSALTNNIQVFEANNENTSEGEVESDTGFYKIFPLTSIVLEVNEHCDLNSPQAAYVETVKIAKLEDENSQKFMQSLYNGTYLDSDSDPLKIDVYGPYSQNSVEMEKNGTFAPILSIEMEGVTVIDQKIDAVANATPEETLTLTFKHLKWSSKILENPSDFVKGMVKARNRYL